MDESWEDMDPSDISALVAEVVDDYKRMGLELALLNIQGASSADASQEKNSGPSGTGANGVKQKKERGRLNCLIIEMERVRRSNFFLCFLFPLSCHVLVRTMLILFYCIGHCRV